MDPTTLSVAKIVTTLILTMVALCVVLRLMMGKRDEYPREPTFLPPLPRRTPDTAPPQSGRDRNRPCKCGSGRKFKHCCWGVRVV